MRNNFFAYPAKLYTDLDFVNFKAVTL